MVQRFLIATGVAVLLLIPSVARADVHSGSGADPQDQPDSLSGPARPDVQSVSVWYDEEAGAVTVRVRFYRPIDASMDRGFSAVITTGSPGPSGDCTGYEPYLIVGTSLRQGSYASLNASGFDGSLVMKRADDDDGQGFLLTAADQRLNHRQATCATADTSVYDEYGHCGGSNCAYWSHSYTDDAVAAFALDGNSPAPPFPSPAPATDPPAPKPPSTTADVPPKSTHACRSLFFVGMNDRIVATSVTCAVARALIRSWNRASCNKALTACRHVGRRRVNGYACRARRTGHEAVRTRCSDGAKTVSWEWGL